MTWIAPLFSAPANHAEVADIARRQFVARVTLASAALGGVVVARLHLSFFCNVDADQLWESTPTFFGAFVSAFLVLALLAHWALRKSLAGSFPIRDAFLRSIGAALLSFPVWGVAMSCVAQLFWNTALPRMSVPHVGGPMSSPFHFLPVYLTSGSLISPLVTVPLGALFGGVHASLVAVLVRDVRSRTRQPLATSRVVGSMYVAAVGVGIVTEFLVVPSTHPWWWSAPVAAVLLVAGMGDLLALTMAEHRARRELRAIFAGTSQRMHLPEGSVALPSDAVPLAELEGEPLTLVSGPKAASFRESASREITGLLPRRLAVRYSSASTAP